MKKACPRDNCPAAPSRMVRPIAPTAAAIANRPMFSQNAETYRGSARRTTRAAVSAQRAGTRLAMRSRDVSGTADLLRAEQARGPPQQNADHDHVGHDVPKPSPEEGEGVLVLGDGHLGDAHDQAAHDRPAERVEAADDRGGERLDGRGPGTHGYARTGERRETDAGRDGEDAGRDPGTCRDPLQPDAGERRALAVLDRGAHGQ